MLCTQPVLKKMLFYLCFHWRNDPAGFYVTFIISAMKENYIAGFIFIYSEYMYMYFRQPPMSITCVNIFVLASISLYNHSFREQHYSQVFFFFFFFQHDCFCLQNTHFCSFFQSSCAIPKSQVRKAINVTYIVFICMQICVCVCSKI